MYESLLPESGFTEASTIRRKFDKVSSDCIGFLGLCAGFARVSLTSLL